MFKNFIYKEYIEGKTIYEHLFLLCGIFLQIFVYLLTNDGVITLISGISGIISVVLCSQRKITFYLFGFIQLFTYIWLAYKQHFYAEIFENIFYFVTMIYGIWLWKNNIDNNQNVKAKKLTLLQHFLIGFGMCISILILWKYLYITNDTQPFMDALTTIPAFIAQILLMYRYREQWIYWGIIDIASIFMWLIAGNWLMVIQFIFWTINCLYGYIKWTDN